MLEDLKFLMKVKENADSETHSEHNNFKTLFLRSVISDYHKKGTMLEHARTRQLISTFEPLFSC